MKYIRTKDGVYKVDMVCPHIIFVNDCTFGINRETTEIIKQADTIEELCDEFVVWFDELKTPSQFREWHLARKYKNVFGAIWTEWGLKYVAKMNEKGELELL